MPQLPPLACLVRALRQAKRMPTRQCSPDTSTGHHFAYYTAKVHVHFVHYTVPATQPGRLSQQGRRSPLAVAFGPAYMYGGISSGCTSLPQQGSAGASAAPACGPLRQSQRSSWLSLHQPQQGWGMASAAVCCSCSCFCHLSGLIGHHGGLLSRVSVAAGQAHACAPAKHLVNALVLELPSCSSIYV